MLMKRFSPLPTRKPLSRSTARNSALINQLATPGLGSLLAGRWVAGIGQLLLAVAGFSLVLCWFVMLLLQTYRDLQGNTAHSQSVAWIGELGGLTFAASWLWALVTSLSLLRQTRDSDPPQAPPPPPPLH